MSPTRRLSSLVLLFSLLTLAGGPTGRAAHAQQLHLQGLTVAPAPEWTALFDRNSGWTGADGIYSIPLSGVDAFGGFRTTGTLFIFGDTFIGEVSRNGSREPGTKIVNNTVAALDLIPGSRLPDPDRDIRFWWSTDPATANPAAAFVPTTPNADPDRDWYWVKDGFVDPSDGQTHLLAYRFRKDSTLPLGFARAGVTLISLPANSRPPFDDQRQAETPFFISKDQSGLPGDMVFGGGVLVNTIDAGSPDGMADGFVYIYGTREDPLSKKLLAARVRPGAIENFDAWRFWNGSRWVAGAVNAAPIAGRVSNELSVTPLADGRFVLIYQRDGVGRFIAGRAGATPIGPFGTEQILYECPEVARIPDVYVYNAKAHPHLSAPGELIVSYNVNSSIGLGWNFDNADIYRPRFIRIRPDGG